MRFAHLPGTSVHATEKGGEAAEPPHGRGRAPLSQVSANKTVFRVRGGDAFRCRGR